MPITLPILIIFLKNLEAVLKPSVPDIHGRAFGVFTRIADSSTKENGILATYNRVLRNEDGTITPYNGTRYLLELLKVPEDVYQRAADRILIV